METGMWIVTKTTCGILGEISKPPEVKAVAATNRNVAERLAKKWFAETIAECNANIEYAKYDINEDGVWYVAQDCVLHTIAVTWVDTPPIDKDGCITE